MSTFSIAATLTVGLLFAVVLLSVLVNLGHGIALVIESRRWRSRYRHAARESRRWRIHKAHPGGRAESRPRTEPHGRRHA